VFGYPAGYQNGRMSNAVPDPSAIDQLLDLLGRKSPAELDDRSASLRSALVDALCTLNEEEAAAFVRAAQDEGR
jgi:hypothetical protein